MTVEITNGKTFAVDQTVTLTFSGTATQGTHYSVSSGGRGYKHGGPPGGSADGRQLG